MTPLLRSIVLAAALAPGLAPLAAQLVPLGAERVVNTTTAGSQFAAGVAGEPGGPFLVVWQSSDQDGSGAGVYARHHRRRPARAEDRRAGRELLRRLERRRRERRYQ